MNETLEVVHCYTGDASLVRGTMDLRHEPVLVLSPADAAVAIEGFECRASGARGWKGSHTWQRQLEHWRIALGSDAEWFLLNDSDSFCLGPVPTYLYDDQDMFWSNVLCHEREHLESDRPNFQPPYFMHRSVLVELEEAMSLFDPTDLDGIEFGVGAFRFTREEFAQEAAIDAMYTHFVMNVVERPWADYPNGATTWPPGTDLLATIAEGADMVHGLKEPLAR